MTLRSPLFGLALVLSSAIIGCDGKPPVLAPARGRIAMFNTPLRNGVVVFTPDVERGTHGPNAVGTIGPDGQYVLMTDGAPGATPGWHRVTIACLEAPAGYRIPDRYQDPSMSGLRAEVRTGSDNVFDFRLETP